MIPEGVGAESPEDIPWMLTQALVDRLDHLSKAYNDDDFREYFALKGVSEFARRAVEIQMTAAEPMAKQLEAMAAYLRKHMK